MFKPWAEHGTAESHGYCTFNHIKKDLPHHQRFARWVYDNFKEGEISIFDVGCGPGWVLNMLPKYDKYVGIDINESCLASAANYANQRTSFYLSDIENSLTEEALQEIEQCKICYIDSTFTMFDSPNKVLEDVLLPNFNFIYLNRTPTDREVTEEGFFQWGGMSKPSKKWNFSKSFFSTVLKNYNHIFTVVDDVVIISNA
jgi:SAM-dependent methyltransferase